MTEVLTVLDVSVAGWIFVCDVTTVWILCEAF